MEKRKYFVDDLDKCKYSDIRKTDKTTLLRNRDIVDILNKQEYIIKELKTRNRRQYYHLKNVWSLIFAKDWKELEKQTIILKKRGDLEDFFYFDK